LRHLSSEGAKRHPLRPQLVAFEDREIAPMEVLGDLRHVGEGRSIRDVLMGGKLDAVDLLPAEPSGGFEPVAAGDEIACRCRYGRETIPKAASR